MAIGIEASVAAVLAILVAIVAHKGPEGYALGVSLYEAGQDRSKMLARVLLCSAMTPVGIVVGATVSGACPAPARLWPRRYSTGWQPARSIYIATLGDPQARVLRSDSPGLKFEFALAGVALISVVSIWA